MIAALVALSAVLGFGVAVGTGTASAAPVRQTWWLDGCGMPKVQVHAWTRPGNYKTVIALDGLRATNDKSGWEYNTRIQDMASSGVNVIEPIGGMASFYSNWDAPSNLNGQKYKYMWSCVINNRLIPMLDQKGLAVGPAHKYAIMGISMGGSSAMIIGANNPRISHLFSMSGYLNLSAPGMRTAIRVAMLDAGIEAGMGPFNSDSMWGPPWSGRWYDNDPFVQINKMHNKKVRIGAGGGFWGQYNAVGSIGDFIGNVEGTPLEQLAWAQTRAFQVQALVNHVPITTDFPIVGTHTWGYWSDMVWRAKNSGWFHD